MLGQICVFNCFVHVEPLSVSDAGAVSRDFPDAALPFFYVNRFFSAFDFTGIAIFALQKKVIPVFADSLIVPLHIVGHSNLVGLRGICREHGANADILGDEVSVYTYQTT